MSIIPFKRILFFLIIFGKILPLWAEKKNPLVQVFLKKAYKKIAPGEKFSIKIQLKIKAPYHIYANDPGESGMPTTLKWQLPQEIKLISIHWPKSKKVEVQGIKNNIYNETITLSSYFSVSPNAKTDKNLSMLCDLSWLSCDQACIPGKTQKKINLLISKKSVMNQNFVIQEKLPLMQKKHFQWISFFLAILMAFLGGIILNIMPCVLPVISLKLMSFLKNTSNNASIRKECLSFSFGILVSFWILVAMLLLLRSLGLYYGWGFQLQSPKFVLGLLLLTFIFSLNMFGLFEIGTSLTGISSKKIFQSQAIPSFINGFFATVVATPCTGPFMASALGYALSQPPKISFAIFTALALGFSFPYLLIALYPQWIKKMPRSGAWTLKIKKIMAFALMGTSLWLLSILSVHIDPKQIITILSYLISISFFLWIHGQWNNKKTLLLTIAILFFSTQKLSKNLSHHEKNSLWIPFDHKKIAHYRKEGHPVFVNCTATWCVSCQVNKKIVLNRKATLKLFKENNVILMEADWTKNNPLITKYLESFHFAGVPLYVYYPKDPSKNAQILPQILKFTTIQNLFLPYKKTKH